MKRILAALAAALAALVVAAAPAHADAPDLSRLGNIPASPDDAAVLAPGDTFHLTHDCMGMVGLYQMDGVTEFSSTGVPTDGGGGFRWDDPDGSGSVTYDDDVDTFENDTDTSYIAAMWCSSVTGGSTVTPPAPAADPEPAPAADPAPAPATTDPAPAPAEPIVVSTHKRSPLAAAKARLRHRLHGYRVTCRRHGQRLACVARKGHKRRAYTVTADGHIRRL